MGPAPCAPNGCVPPWMVDTHTHVPAVASSSGDGIGLMVVAIVVTAWAWVYEPHSEDHSVIHQCTIRRVPNRRVRVSADFGDAQLGCYRVPGW